MTLLRFVLQAQNEYSIQSPFLYRLATEVLLPRLDRATRRRTNIRRGDRCAQLRYKLANHFGTEWQGNRLALPDGSLLILTETPHCCAQAEKQWEELVNDETNTLTVDLYYAGLAFTTRKLAKQHVMLR